MTVGKHNTDKGKLDKQLIMYGTIKETFKKKVKERDDERMNKSKLQK